MKKVSLVTLRVIVVLVCTFALASGDAVRTAKAEAWDNQVIAVGDAVIEQIIVSYSKEGTTYFVFDDLPRLYEVGAYVHQKLPYNVFGYAKSYHFSWGDGRQLVIDLQDEREAHLAAMRVVRQEAEDIRSQGGTKEEWFEQAFQRVSTSVTYATETQPNRREQTFYGAVLDQHAVCNGYAAYMAALLNQLDIPAFKVHTKNTALAYDEGHAIVAFYSEGTWQLSDPTSYSCAFNQNRQDVMASYYQYDAIPAHHAWSPRNITDDQAEAFLLLTGAKRQVRIKMKPDGRTPQVFLCAG